jgi:hypothetical protein
MEVIAALGRLPAPTEFAGTQAVVERFGSLKRAFAVIRRITDAELWESIARRRREDMLPRKFEIRMSKSKTNSKSEIRTACLTFRIFVLRICFGFRYSDFEFVTIGKLLPDDLYVHKSALDSLTPILRDRGEKDKKKRGPNRKTSWRRQPHLRKQRPLSMAPRLLGHPRFPESTRWS